MNPSDKTTDATQSESTAVAWEVRVLKAKDGNLYHNTPNQLRRAVGPYTVIHLAGRCGTVRDRDGKDWDWWETAEMADATFPKIKVVPAT